MAIYTQANKHKNSDPKASSKPHEKPDRRTNKQGTPQKHHHKNADLPRSVGLLDRVTDMFQRAKRRWRQAEELVAQVLGPPRSRSP